VIDAVRNNVFTYIYTDEWVGGSGAAFDCLVL
jgi:hypothetical protein